MKASQVYKTVESAHKACRLTKNYLQDPDIEPFLPQDIAYKDSRMMSISNSLGIETALVEESKHEGILTQEELDELQEHALAVRREAITTLAKAKAIVAANKLEISYCEFA